MTEMPQFHGRLEIDPSQPAWIWRNPDGSVKGVIILPKPDAEVRELPTHQDLYDDGWVQLGALDVDDESEDQQ